MRELVVGDDFTVRVKLADATSDELGCLRPKVENDNLFLHRLDSMDGFARKVTKNRPKTVLLSRKSAKFAKTYPIEPYNP
jgi:hypothetical protein